MLGRLFRQSSLEQFNRNQTVNEDGDPDGATNTRAGNSSTSSYDDSYTREFLYGTSSLKDLCPNHINKAFFRVIVSQDGGNLRSKQVLFDSASQDYEAGGNEKVTMSKIASRKNQTHNAGILTSKIHHNANELNDYMFGCGLPTNEFRSSTKVHLLSLLNNLIYGSNRSVLVTRLFLLTESEDELLLLLDAKDEMWRPRSALPVSETFEPADMCASPRKCKSLENIRLKGENLNGRFAIGLIIPLDTYDHLTESVFNNWEEISRYLVLFQALISKKVKTALSYNVSNFTHLSSLSVYDWELTDRNCPYIVNRRIQLPNYAFQNEHDLHHQLKKLIKLIYYDSNLPRLINSNSIIRYNLENDGSTFFSLVRSWVSEVSNWMEFRDGQWKKENIQRQCKSKTYRGGDYSNSTESLVNSVAGGLISPYNNGNAFLATLIAYLKYIKQLLEAGDQCPFANGVCDLQNTRVVVSSNNPVVAKKLVFIINGFFEDKKFMELLGDKESLLASILETSYGDGNDTSLHEGSCQDVEEHAKHRDKLQNDLSQHQNLSSSDLNEQLLAENNEVKKELRSSPIPIRKQSSTSLASLDESWSHPFLSKNWEKPHKAVASTSTVPSKSRVETVTNVIPIASSDKDRYRSLSKSSSMAYLSSSLNSSCSSSASNYSLSKLGSSFFDKWRSSHGTQPNTFSYPKPHVPGIEDAPLLVSGSSIPRKNSLQLLRTPSPMVDRDEYFLRNGTCSTVPGHIYNVNSGAYFRSPRADPSFEHTEVQGDKHHSSREMTRKGKDIRRNKTSVYLPNDPSFNKVNVLNYNRCIIREKCRQIFHSNLSMNSQESSTLYIEGENFGSGGAATKCGTEDNSDLVEESNNSRLVPVKSKVLPPSVAYSEEFRPEFMLQSCPVYPRLEAQIIKAMREDLLFRRSDFRLQKPSSKTVLVDLRTRQIKVFDMAYVPFIDSGSSEHKGNSYPFQKGDGALSMPSGLYSSGTESSTYGRDYRISVNCIYSPTQNLLNKESIESVESNLAKLSQLFHSGCFDEIDTFLGESKDTRRYLCHLLSCLLA